MSIRTDLETLLTGEVSVDTDLRSWRYGNDGECWVLLDDYQVGGSDGTYQTLRVVAAVNISGPLDKLLADVWAHINSDTGGPNGTRRFNCLAYRAAYGEVPIPGRSQKPADYVIITVSTNDTEVRE